MAAIMDDTAEGAMKRMQSAVEGAQIAIGTALAPAVVDVWQMPLETWHRSSVSCPQLCRRPLWGLVLSQHPLAQPRWSQAT